MALISIATIKIIIIIIIILIMTGNAHISTLLCVQGAEKQNKTKT